MSTPRGNGLEGPLGSTPPSDAVPGESSYEASFWLMMVVTGVLSVALLGLVSGMVYLAAERISVPGEVNTLTSLIAGGLVGFLTPHASKTLSRRSSQSGHNK